MNITMLQPMQPIFDDTIQHSHLSFQVFIHSSSHSSSSGSIAAFPSGLLTAVVVGNGMEVDGGGGGGVVVEDDSGES